VEEKIVQIADDAVQSVTTGIDAIEISPTNGGGREQFDDILFFNAGQPARVLQGFSRF